MRICSQTANIHATASIDSETTSQGLFGEHVNIVETTDNWAQVELQFDGYTGFMEIHHLGDDAAPHTHRVSNKLTLLFNEPDIKSAVSTVIPLASELVLQACEHDQFFQTQQHKFIWKQHACARGTYIDGPLVNTAQTLFLGSPYLWGGRSPLGLDCSALVQLCALLHGWQLPRDTQDQVAFFRDPSTCAAEEIVYSKRQKNDLVYWPGHVAIVIDHDTVVHATAHTLQCCRESLRSVEDRAGAPESIWRLSTIKEFSI